MVLCAFLVNNSESGEITDGKIDIDSIHDIPKVIMNFNQSNCDISCNNDYKTVYYSHELYLFSEYDYDEINNFIGNYFGIGSIRYNNNRNILNFNCSYVANNIPCILIIRNEFNNEQLPRIKFATGDNQFYGIKLSEFESVSFYQNDFYRVKKFILISKD